MRRLVYLLPVVVFVVIAGYFAWGLRPNHDPHTLPSAMIDKPVPAFDLASLKEGEDFARSEIAGQVVLVNFFASWCVPCRSEHPVLMRISEQEHVPLYGIAYKDRPADAAHFLDQLGNPYRRIGLDREGRVGIDFGVYGVPETYVIDKAGRIRLRHVGPLTAEALENELLPLVKELNRS
jgi:cytochrome c biogenesis protein CcmG/thiol:disulfide interchange protein DsbE